MPEKRFKLRHGLVAAAENGTVALQKMKDAVRTGTGFRLVIADGCMPTMSGFELAQRIKPVGKSELLSSILRALQESLRTDVCVAVQPNSSQTLWRLRILVAEDNLVNQTVILRMLRNLGHEPTIAHNGKEAVAALQSGVFDLVLMDIQMPEMDGLDAARRVREIESRTGLHIPIVAMTAHAMKGDKETCLEAGMDGYIAKPATSREIAEMIAKMVPGAYSRDYTEQCSPQRPALWDPLNVMKHLGGDETLFQELIQIFLQEAPGQLEKLGAAIERAEKDAIAQTAHSLKGELKYLGLTNAAEQAAKLERMETHSRLLIEEFHSLEAEIHAAIKAMQAGLQSSRIASEHTPVSSIS